MREKHVLLHVSDRTLGPYPITLGNLNRPVTLEDYRDEAVTCALEDGELAPEEVALVKATVSEPPPVPGT